MSEPTAAGRSCACGWRRTGRGGRGRRGHDRARPARLHNMAATRDQVLARAEVVTTAPPDGPTA